MFWPRRRGHPHAAARGEQDEHCFRREGNDCGNCVKHVTKAVQGAQPGAEVNADLASGKVTVTPAQKTPPPSPRRSPTRAIRRNSRNSGEPRNSGLSLWSRFVRR